MVKGVGHLGHDEAMEAGGREFDPRPGHYSACISMYSMAEWLRAWDTLATMKLWTREVVSSIPDRGAL